MVRLTDSPDKAMDVKHHNNNNLCNNNFNSVKLSLLRVLSGNRYSLECQALIHRIILVTKLT